MTNLADCTDPMDPEQIPPAKICDTCAQVFFAWEWDGSLNQWIWNGPSWPAPVGYWCCSWICRSRLRIQDHSV